MANLLNYEQAVISARGLAKYNGFPAFVVNVCGAYAIDDVQPPTGQNYFLVDDEGKHISRQQHEKNLSTQKTLPLMKRLERKYHA